MSSKRSAALCFFAQLIRSVRKLVLCCEVKASYRFSSAEGPGCSRLSGVFPSSVSSPSSPPIPSPPLEDLIHRSAVELLRQSEAAALIFASESREMHKKWERERETRGTRGWVASSMFKEGGVLGEVGGTVYQVCRGCTLHGTPPHQGCRYTSAAGDRLGGSRGQVAGCEVELSDCREHV